MWEDNKKDVDIETWMDHCREVEDCHISGCGREESCLFKAMKRDKGEGRERGQALTELAGGGAMCWEDQSKEEEMETKEEEIPRGR